MNPTTTLATDLEQDCKFELSGVVHRFGGASVCGNQALLYAYPEEKMVGNWHGDQKVPALYGRIWRSNMGDIRQHVTFTWAGRRYSGTYYKSRGDLIRARMVK